MTVRGGIQSGFTLLETLIGLAILAIVSTAIYSAYGNVLQIVQSSQYNSAALDIIESQVEAVRNMRYEDVGTVGGIPAGTLLASKSVSVDKTLFLLHTYVRSIDDPFDGTLGGNPNDAAPADYKLVQFQVTCDTCPRYNIISMATYAAPKNLENSSKRGALLINAIDASGFPIAGATVHITNTKVSPHIDITDTTNTSGQLQLLDVATSSAGYHVVVSKTGYSTDQTYPPGGTPANPVKPDATVANQQLTILSLSIDRVSTVNVTTQDQFCAEVGSFDFLMTGTKLIGVSPDTPKYSAAHATDSTGALSLNTVEWDTYAFKPTDTSHAIAGTFTPLSMTVNPNSTATQQWYVAPLSGNALSISVADSGGSLINDATATLTKTGFSASAMTGQATLGDTDWSGNNFTAKSALMDASAPGTLTLAQVGGVYATSSEQWLESRTFDMGTASTSFATFTFGSSQPSGTSLRFQLAGNTDNATWNYVGPDGTAASYFTSSGQSIPTSLGGDRYIRYKVFMSTDNPQHTPSLDELAAAFRSACTVPGAAYLSGLTSGTYTLTVTKSGYQPSTTSVDISTSWQQAAVTLTP